MQSLEIRGVDPKKGKKSKKDKDEEEEGSDEEDKVDEEDDVTTTVNQDDATASVEPSMSLGDAASTSMSRPEEEEDSHAGDSVDPIMWKCDKCYTKNLASENKDGGSDHCTLCGASRPDYHHGHGIGALTDNADLDDQTKLVQASLSKKGNIEGSHKHDPNVHYDSNDPKAPLYALHANEHAKHTKNELDSDAEESDIEASSETDSDSDDELDDNEEADMLKFVRTKLEERKREQKLAREAEKERRRRKRRR